MLGKILFYYCFLFTLFITISGVLNSTSPNMILMQAFFLPVLGYFIFNFIYQILHKNKPTTSSIKSLPRKRKKKGFVIATLILLLLISTSVYSITNKKANLSPPSPSLNQTEDREVLSATNSASPKNTPTASQSASISKATNGFLMIKTDSDSIRVNIRRNATSSAEILEKTIGGTTYKFIDKQKDWYEIILKNNKTGFVHKDFVNIR